jgi:two-component system OmpR family sensor kinase
MLLRRCGGSWQAAPPHERRRGSRQYLSDIAEDVTEVEQILDDIIATARLDLANQQSKDPYPPLRLTPVPVAALLDALTRRFADQHAGRSLKISVDETITLDADRVMLKLALANVLDNAHKYSCPDQPIALKVVRGDDLTFAETERVNAFETGDMRILCCDRGDKSRSA